MAITSYKLLKGATQSQLSQAVQLELSLGNRVLVYQAWSRGGYLCQGVGVGTLATGTVSSYNIITNANDESFAALVNNQIPYYQPIGTPVIHNNALYQVMGVVTPGSPSGTPGKNPVLRVAAGYIQWKYEGDLNWINLVALSSISGPSVQIGVDSGYIMWKQSNSEYWEQLVSLDSLKGPANTLSIGTVNTGNAAATITGNSPSQTLNLTLPQGPSNVLSMGTVTTLAPGASATATISGTSPAQTLNLGLPAGANGTSPTLTVGNITTLAAGQSATVTITGNAPNYTLNIGIPQGAKGEPNTLTVGTVTTGNAAATITGTAPSQTLNLTLPRGATGTGAVNETVSGTVVTAGTAVAVTFAKTYTAPPNVVPVTTGDANSIVIPIIGTITQTGCSVTVVRTRGTLLLSAGPVENAPAGTAFRIVVTGN